jgi:acyl homoserine lactone synthase
MVTEFGNLLECHASHALLERTSADNFDLVWPLEMEYPLGGRFIAFMRAESRVGASDRYGEFHEDLTEMHRLRYRVFKERLDWEVETAGDMEVESFDALLPSYLLLKGQSGSVTGCVRLLPSTEPTMLRDTFPDLLDGSTAPSRGDIWESSRFALDDHKDAPAGEHAVASPTYALFAGMVEFGLAHGLQKIVTVTDARMERILRRAG